MLFIITGLIFVRLRWLLESEKGYNNIYTIKFKWSVVRQLSIIIINELWSGLQRENSDKTLQRTPRFPRWQCKIETVFLLEREKTNGLTRSPTIILIPRRPSENHNKHQGVQYFLFPFLPNLIFNVSILSAIGPHGTFGVVNGYWR